MLPHFHLYGEQRSSGVMGRRNGPSGLRDDDDDSTLDESKSIDIVFCCITCSAVAQHCVKAHM